jgi:hypothetical protein
MILENAVGSRKSAQAVDSSVCRITVCRITVCRITSYMKKVLITNKVTSGTPPAFFSLRYLNQSFAHFFHALLRFPG